MNFIYMLYASFWVIPRLLNFICRRFGTLFHLHRRICTVRPPRQKAKVGSGTLQNLPVPRKREWANPKSNRCSFVLFDSQEIVHKEFVPPGQTVNQTFYQEVLERLRKRVARVRPCIARTWILHHDKAPCHTAVYINEFLTEKKHSCGSSAPRIRRISVPVISFYSQAQKPLQKGAILVLWITSRRA